MAKPAWTISGVKETLKELGATEKEIERSLAAALWQKGLQIIGVSVNRVPVDSGRLKQSAYAAPPTNDRKPRVELGYGTDYALPVHEKVEVFHKVGGPLFLKSALDEAKRGFQSWIARQTAVNWKKKIGVSSVPSRYPERPKKES